MHSYSRTTILPLAQSLHCLKRVSVSQRMFGLQRRPTEEIDRSSPRCLAVSSMILLWLATGWRRMSSHV